MSAVAVAQHAGSGAWSWLVIVAVLAAAGGLLRPSLTSLASLRRYAAAWHALAAAETAERETGAANELEFLRLHRELAEAEAAVPRWLRWEPVWRRIERTVQS